MTGLARRWGLMLLAPISALVFALAVTAAVLALSGESALQAYRLMWEYGTRTDSLVATANRAMPLYLSAVAVAIGFRMALFNIGVEGQYRLAALVAAAVGAAVTLPPVLHIPLMVVVAMIVGGAWAGIAGVLRVTRGVNEVISTIMLNYIGAALSAYLLAHWFKASNEANDFVIKTRDLPTSAHMPNLNGLLRRVGIEVPIGAELYGFLVLAVVVGAAFHVLLYRTRFGFDLRASGLNPLAARASGVDSRAMVVRAMVLSGAVAGLVGLPQIMSFSHRYTLDFTAGLGFTGIAVALVGRNHPGGMALSAVLFGFLERSTQVLDLEGIPKEIVAIMQGVIILSVVIAYEVVRRVLQAAEMRAAGARTGEPPAALEVPV